MLMREIIERMISTTTDEEVSHLKELAEVEQIEKELRLIIGSHKDADPISVIKALSWVMCTLLCYVPEEGRKNVYEHIETEILRRLKTCKT
jgi:hypothetical protein